MYASPPPPLKAAIEAAVVAFDIREFDVAAEVRVDIYISRGVMKLEYISYSFVFSTLYCVNKLREVIKSK